MGLFGGGDKPQQPAEDDKPEVFDDTYWEGVDAGGHSWGMWGK